MMIDQNNLPFPCDSIIDGNNIADPYAVALPVPPSTPESAIFLQAMAAGLITLLQQNARGGHISAFAYNLFSHNRYNNEFWMAVISDAYDLAVKIQTCNPNASQEQVVAMAVRKYHAYAVANCVNHFPVLQQIVNSQAVNNAITAANQFKTESQQLDIQYQRLSQQQNTNSMIGMTIPGAGGQTQQVDLGLAGGSLIGGLAAFGTSLIQDEPTGNGGWGRARRAPAGSAVPAEPVAEVVQPVREPVKQETAHVIGSLDQSGKLSMLNMSLTPRRAARAPDPDDSPATVTLNDDSVVPTPTARQPAATTVTDPLLVETNDPLTDLGFEEPTAPVAPTEQRAAPASEEPVKQRAHTSAQKARTMVIPLSLRVLPDTLEEAVDAIHAADMAEGLARIDDIECAIYVVDEAGEGEAAFGTYLSENNQLVQVVHANDKGWKTTDDQKVRVVYNPLKWHRAFVQSVTSENELYGPLVEGFIPIEEGDSMDYMDLEIDPIERTKALARLNNGKQYIPLKGEVLEVVPVERMLLSIGSNPSSEKKDNKHAEAARVETRNKIASCSAARGKRKEAISSCVELSNLVLNNEVNYLAATVPATNGFRVRHTAHGKRLTVKPIGEPIRYLREQLAELMVLVPSLAKQLDRMIAVDVNRLLEFSFGYSEVEITSFTNDWNDVVDHLLEIYADDTVNLFQKAVNSKLGRWVIIDTGDEIIADGDCYCVVTPAALEDLGVELLSNDLGVITMSNSPNLVDIMAKGKANADNVMVSPDIYFMGRDGEIWRAHESVFDSSFSVLVRC